MSEKDFWNCKQICSTWSKPSNPEVEETICFTVHSNVQELEKNALPFDLISLPEELVIKTLANLDTEDLSSVRQVSKYLNHLATPLFQKQARLVFGNNRNNVQLDAYTEFLNTAGDDGFSYSNIEFDEEMGLEEPIPQHFLSKYGSTITSLVLPSSDWDYDDPDFEQVEAKQLRRILCQQSTVSQH